MAVLGQIVLPQNLHDSRAVLCCNLDDHAQLFIEQSLERELFSACANLLCPVFGIAVFGPTVADAVAFSDQ